MADDVRTELQDGILTLTLARPGKKNALTQEMYATLGARIGAADEDPDVRCVLIAADGDTFCGGNDLQDFAAMAQDPDLQWQGNPLLTALTETTTPVVAAVQGPAVGIGTTLLLHCDAVVLADDARLSTPFADLGLVPEAASSLLLPARVGHLRAFAMLALGEVVPAARAVDWGLASTVVPASELLATALSLARAVADRAPGAMATTKALLRDVGALTARLDVEGAAFVERLRSPEARAAFERFLGHAG